MPAVVLIDEAPVSAGTPTLATSAEVDEGRDHLGRDPHGSPRALRAGDAGRRADAPGPALSGRPGPERSLHELADRYLTELERVYPSGDVVLYGYSLGGVIAVKLALRLQARGRTVRVLALGDTSAPGTEVVTRGPDEPIWSRARRRAAELRALSPGKRITRVRLLARHQRNSLALRLRSSLVRRREAVARAAIVRAMNAGEAVAPDLRGEFVLGTTA